MSIYSEAVLAIQAHVAARQAELDAAVAAAVAEADRAIKADLLAEDGGGKCSKTPIAQTHPAIKAFAAATIGIAQRESDGYPWARIPDETSQLLAIAVRAGLVRTAMFGGYERDTIGRLAFRDNMTNWHEIHPAVRAAYEAWERAKRYREATAGAKSL